MNDPQYIIWLKLIYSQESQKDPLLFKPATQKPLYQTWHPHKLKQNCNFSRGIVQSNNPNFLIQRILRRQQLLERWARWITLPILPDNHIHRMNRIINRRSPDIPKMAQLYNHDEWKGLYKKRFILLGSMKEKDNIAN